MTEYRREYFKSMGELYESYHFPALCGWIEALMLLEEKEWTQKSLSDRLSELFPEPDSPTSISAINRAVKVLEEIGTIKKSGSRKIGYYYNLNPSIQAAISKFENLAQINDTFAKNLNSLKDSLEIKSDPKLQEVIAKQLKETIRLSTYFQRFVFMLNSWIRRENELEGNKQKENK